MTYPANFNERMLPVALALAGITMTVLSIMLLINAAQLGIFLRMMLGFIGVILVNSVILSFVTIRIAVGAKDNMNAAERVVLLGLSFFTGIGLMVA